MEPPGRPIQQVLRPQLWSCDWPGNRRPEHISEVISRQNHRREAAQRGNTDQEEG